MNDCGKLKLGVSACLLGLPTRYDGKSKPCPAIIAAAAEFDFLPICPESKAGLRIPREPMDLYGDPAAPRAIPRSGSADHTDAVLRAAERRLAELRRRGVCGLVLKARSPSCGVSDTPLYRPERVVPERGEVIGFGAVLFTRRVLESDPDFPVIDENDWQNPEKRRIFLEKAKKIDKSC